MVHAPPSKQIDGQHTTYEHPASHLATFKQTGEHAHLQAYKNLALQQLYEQTHLRHLAHDPHSNTVWGKSLAHCGLTLAVPFVFCIPHMRQDKLAPIVSHHPSLRSRQDHLACSLTFENPNSEECYHTNACQNANTPMQTLHLNETKQS